MKELDLLSFNAACYLKVRERICYQENGVYEVCASHFPLISGKITRIKVQ